MATERTHTPDDQIPYPDELDPSITAVERLEAGRESGEYTGMRESDLAVLAYLTAEQWHAVKRDPSLLPRILTPTAHA